MQCDGQKSCSTGFAPTAPMHIFKQTFTKANIYSNGYITMNTPFEGRQPKRGFRSMFDSTKMADALNKGFAMIAPLWTDNDGRYGSVFYQVYDKALGDVDGQDSANATTVFERAQRDVNYHSSHTNVDVAFVGVITWVGMLPRMWYNPLLDQPNTFQLVLIQDPKKWLTFALFLYEKTGWNNVVSLRGNLAGYYVVGPQVNKTHLGPHCFKPFGLRLATKPGNRRRTGESFYKLSDLSHDPNYDHMCRVWYGNEDIDADLFAETLPCPCNMATVNVDVRWRPDGVEYPDGKTCFYERMSSKLAVQSCCYGKLGYLLTRKDGSAGPTFRHHPRHYNHHRTDWEPHYWCCVKSHNCDKFYEVRPVDTCDSYQAPYIGWMLGDPHMRTLDGFRYTFNGLGEYTLLTTRSMAFTLQARTTKARAMDGSDVNATIVSAVVAQAGNSERVHVELNGDKTGLAIFVDYENHTAWQTEANIGDEKVFHGFTISKEKKSSVIVAFPNGIVLTVAANEGRLDLSLLAPVELQDRLTRGLFGVFDGDPTNDLTPVRKDGTNGIRLSMSGSSERSIYNNFAESWRTQTRRKLFYYHKGTSVMTYDKTNFRPSFSDEILGEYLSSLTSDQSAKVNSTCKQSNECLFDLALTKNAQFAASTREQIERNIVAQNVLAYGNPILDGPEELNVTVGKPITFAMTAMGDVDDDPADVDIRNVTALPVGAAFNQSKQSFTWTPRNADAVDISFVAVDKHGSMSAEQNVIINMCGCSEHGTCLFDQLANGQYYSSIFRVVACQCDVGWTGEYCEENFDGCADSPCTMGTTCTDVHPVEHAQGGKAFFCSECPKGYEKNYEICVDINECQLTTTNKCSQLCLNAPEVSPHPASARVRCDCRAGYKLAPDGASCIDFDECAALTSSCEQRCNNTVGSYLCHCYGGYALKKNQHACIISAIDHCKSVACQNGGTCLNLVNDYKCVCAAGYTGTNCEQEASPCVSNPCIHGGSCQGDSKTYVCQCPRGYFGNRCEYELDNCLSDPCMNGGSCLDEADRYYCLCRTGFMGVNCTLRGEPCSSKPCFNGATCIATEDLPSGYICRCAKGYIGRQCHYANKILRSIKFRIVNMTYESDLGMRSSSSYRKLANTLKSKLEAIYMKSEDVGPHFAEITHIGFSNGSVIVDCILSLRVDVAQSVLNSILKQAFREKELLPHYELSVMSVGVNHCESLPCQNGGTCQIYTNDYNCSCADGFTGKHCETENVAAKTQIMKPSKNRTGIIIGSVVGVIVALGIAVAVVFMYRRLRKGNEPDTVEMVSHDNDDMGSTI